MAKIIIVCEGPEGETKNVEMSVPTYDSIDSIQMLLASRNDLKAYVASFIIESHRYEVGSGEKMRNEFNTPNSWPKSDKEYPVKGERNRTESVPLSVIKRIIIEP